MKCRKILARVHRWLALPLGGLFALTAASGALLVFGPEIDRALNPHLFRATPGAEVGFDRACAAVQRIFPERAIGRIDAPAMPRTGGVYVVRLTGDPATLVHVDPGTGAILGARREGESLVGWLAAVHIRLAAGEVGERIVGFGGLLLLTVIATGCGLWWTGRKTLAQGLRIRRGRGRFLFHYDLHKLVGIASAPLLAMIVLMGVFLTFEALADAVIYGLFGTTPPPRPAPASLWVEPNRTATVPLELLRRVAEQQAVPGATTVNLTLPQEPGDPAVVRLKYPDSPLPNGRCYVHLDPSSGWILRVEDEREFTRAERLRRSWPYPLHIGVYGGGPMRALHVLVGLAPAVLLGTGLVIRRQRTRSRRAAAWAQRGLGMNIENREVEILNRERRE
ncbi:MAG: PepSY domain-containing protein [Isosphaeraceae bacterium]|nr:PepSY domain-containing protein [Isosphaeraceae bacterium]